MRAIAGIVNDAGNVLGMMPHPERAVDPLLGSADGLGVFESVLARVTAYEETAMIAVSSSLPSRIAASHAAAPERRRRSIRA